ncbi:hypothetical protein EJ04DRAFT_430033 [Polyplosphaeria fusca]|uniref:Transcription initiation factor TFIID subunit 1 histone acetyltransferase domain-containing protein n=1 Tax=Polyplosphaeria fusca TaxID=682080 RepID=A0A9P4V711_9PLEO|nr:hypothetical protein EJ04DRAFT_430033 [Polyplosphaeria fusca]
MDSFLNEIAVRPLEIGEKDAGAIDYEDISDNDLPDEEDTQQLSGTTVQGFDDDTQDNDEDDDLDALFGGSSPPQDGTQHDEPFDSIELNGQGLSDILGSDATGLLESGSKAQPTFRTVHYGGQAEEVNEEFDEEFQEQMRLFSQAKLGHNELPPPESSKEYFERLWPNFEKDKPPRFYSLIPRKRAFYPMKVPLKAPKELRLNKVSLDLAPDHEKGFRLPSTSAPLKAGRQLEDGQGGIIRIMDSVEEDRGSVEEMELEDFEVEDDQEMIGNVTWNDLQIACEDWETPSLEDLSDDEETLMSQDTAMDGNDWIRNLGSNIPLGPPAKKRRLGDALNPSQFSIYDHMTFPSLDDPELATAKISKRIVLDMNDPYLLLDVQQPSAEQKKPRPAAHEFKRDSRGSLANPMFKRYNISNDEAYDALKESHQQKVRSTLGHMNIEHSLPALKLQYPFYKVHLSDRELRSFHRPTINFKPGERVRILENKSVKRKHKKNLKVSEAFATAEDLSVGDTSDLLLAEYSEEYPTTLSNFGMGVKIVNYYRRKDNDDTTRPKRELGETHVLLPQDKSPFSLFGKVDEGETVPTLHNAMYRAPVFQHDTKSTDFLVSRSSTGVNGSKYYMRNMQSLVAVGQEFPSVEVPGTHARKVTEASKKRLKMLSFRLYRRGQQRGARQPWVSNEMIKHHLPGTEIAQNRSRMREIMKYDKERGTWIPQEGDVVPDEPTLRTWIKPEDVCLIDSMHAGDKHLMDAGFKSAEIDKDEEQEDSDNTELKLAPWHTTKNFLNACAGKAMLELWGQGDPTGRGEAFSFIKVSMKGGFKDVGESMADKLDAKKIKELGGHSYNVARQQKQYEDAILRIWNKQRESLGSKQEHSDVEMDVDSVEVPQASTRRRTPRSEFGTPALLRDDESASQLSRNSKDDTHGKVLKIKRRTRNGNGELVQENHVITDEEVVRSYSKRKKEERLFNMKIDEIKPTGNAEFDAQQEQKLRAELARLTRNVERREGREKAKGIVPTVPGTPGGITKSTGATPRKCANCGEAGHIKTNKK